MQDCLDREHSSQGEKYDFPRYEKIKFTSLRTHFRTTNWTPLGDGLPTSQTSDLTKANFTFAEPTGATAFGWEERIFEIGISSVNIFKEESTIKPSDTYVGVTTSGVSETSVSAIDTGECPDISVYLTKAAFEDSYRKKIKYYMKDTQSMFSFKANLVPFLPTVQSNRASMAGKMMTQATPFDVKEELPKEFEV